MAGSRELPNKDATMATRTGTFTKVNENVTILESDIPRPARRRLLVTKAPATFDNVALVAAAIGIHIGIGIGVMFLIPSLGTYMISIGMFHLLEFWVTAKYNVETLGMYSFLLLNGLGYAGAHALSVFEYICKWYIYGKPGNLSVIPYIVTVVCLVVGQVIRSSAMIHAKKSFNHFVQVKRREDHTLVKTGVYAYVRHPSYFGYYFWTIASQVLLRNYISASIYIIILQVYFTQRLKHEEDSLIKFFGHQYIEYRKNVWSGIPFWK